MSAPFQPLVWNDSYATGVTEIDEQHMILVHTLNEAGVTLVQNCNQESLEQITQDLLSYALYHFDTEEALMQEYDYPSADGSLDTLHHEQHRAFSAKVVAVREGIKSGNLISADELLGFLNNWLVNHILHTDKHLGAFVSAKRRAE